MGKLLNKHKLLHQINTWINGGFFFPLCQKQSIAMLTLSAEAVSQPISLSKAEMKSWNIKPFPFTLSPEFKVLPAF